MILKNITIKNFRNYSDVEIVFDEKINIFYGNNAEGKTNILESIYILALTKSHRGSKSEELIKFEEDFLKITGDISLKEKNNTQEIVITKGNKKVKINDIEEKRLSHYISHLNVLIFTPDDLEIVKGSPGSRRQLLNVDIGQLDNKYLDILNEYNIILKMRNEYLRNGSETNDKYFEIITERLVKNAVKIYKYRKDFLDKVNSSIGEIYKKITDFNKLSIKYNTVPSFIEYNDDSLQNVLMEEFDKNFSREKHYGKTLFGPHLDDFSFYLNELDLKLYGSQGQQRAAVLAFKFAEIKLFKETPILLLDDVLSELDKIKKNKLIDYINRDVQTIITTTNIKNISKSLLNVANIYKVENNKVIREEVKSDAK